MITASFRMGSGMLGQWWSQTQIYGWSHSWQEFQPWELNWKLWPRCYIWGNTRDTDNQYAFATAHISGATYTQRGLLMTEGRTKLHPREQQDRQVGAPKNWAPHIFLFHLFFIYISNDFPFPGSPLPESPISPLPSPCYPIYPFPLPCSSIPLHCCTEPFQNHGRLLPSSWTSFDMWIVSWVFQASRLISVYQWVLTMSVLLRLGYLT